MRATPAGGGTGDGVIADGSAADPVPGGPASTDERTAAILAAARAVAVDIGIRRLTIDEVVRRSGVSRMTVYRRFAGRDEVVVAVIRRELDDAARAVAAAVAGTTGGEARFVGAFAAAVEVLGGNALLTRLLQLEPETLLPYMTTSGHPFVAGATAFLRPYVRDLRAEAGVASPDPGLDAVAETIGRVGLSLRLTPAIVIDLDGRPAVERYAREVLVPLALAGVPRG
ncbi:TetR/AcrR family transcriptional regulator [Patulibacter sp. NPDC049589]|uniref:TetR/AcrR family transcriptional regulator n=1 Tax=Patulibacter sp. NPDC049589 TaxID=3154731 RepID=UPI003426B6F3